MLCQTCHSKDLTNTHFVASYWELYKSGKNGCRVCFILWLSVFRTSRWKRIKFDGRDIDDLHQQNDEIGFLIHFDSRPSSRVYLTDRPLSGIKFLIDPIGVHMSPRISILRVPGAHPEMVPEIPLSGVVARSANSPQCFQTIKRWIAECDRHHDPCKPSNIVPTLPTRIVDVNPTPHGLRPYLVETGGSQAGRYAALSYCWGTARQLKLTQERLEDFKSGIRWEDVPKTLQHAMIITHNLGLRYLWIDALTIIQDDQRDWERESKKMAEVYGNAYFTIAALDSSSCDEGIFFERTVSIQHLRIWPLKQGEGEDYLEIVDSDSLIPGGIYTRVCYNQDFYADRALAYRAWTLQEHILSPRVVGFTMDEVIWQCRCANSSESNPSFEGMESKTLAGKIPALRKINFFPHIQTMDIQNDPLAVWAAILEEYTSRKLTISSDKLPAISGIAAAITSDAESASIFGEYFAGLFRNHVFWMLTWQPYLPARRGFKISHDSIQNGTEWPTRPERYRAPTWSWASINGKVSLKPHYRKESWQCSLLHIDDRQVVLKGRVLPGVLKKSTAIEPDLDANMTFHAKPEAGDSYYRVRYGQLEAGGITFGRVITDTIDTTVVCTDGDIKSKFRGLVETPQNVTCLLLGINHILVLAEVEGMPNVFERVSLIILYGESECQTLVKSSVFTERVVTII